MAIHEILADGGADHRFGGRRRHLPIPELLTDPLRIRRHRVVVVCVESFIRTDSPKRG
jgi:hypothetical protein